MAASQIRDLTLRIESSSDGLRAALLDSEEAEVARCQASSETLENVRRMAKAILSRGSEPSRDDVIEAGRAVAAIAFNDGVKAEIESVFGQGLIRIGLLLPDDLQDMPWELAYLDDSRIGFLLLNPAVRLHRKITVSELPLATHSTDVLLTFANPKSPSYPSLASCEREFASVANALASPECALLTLSTLEHATQNSLSRTLVENRFGVFHFVGHADIQVTGGFLVLEGGEPGEASVLYGEDLAKLLVGAEVKLVVLSSCETAGALESVGTKLALAGIPAVIGMQAAVSDVDAHVFARALYSALASGFSLEEAVYEARTAIRGSAVGWAAPVLTTGRPGHCFFKASAVAEVSSPPARGNLPRPLTSFIGRASLIQDVVRTLKSERLVILLGSGGIGKTRLSIEVGRGSAGDFAHGVWQVLLDSVSAPQEVIPAIARVFGIKESAEAAIDDRLFDFLKDQKLLIVLDNCEHLAESCKDAASRILESCPDVKILATSRVVLDTGADYVVRVPPLSYPPLAIDDPLEFPVEETLRNYEALQLLVLRGKSANSEFEAAPANIEALCRIAKRVDGIPLALELAASRLRSFTPKQIFEKLSKDLAWLDLENPGAVPRHKTLRATLDWSYRMLPEQEKALFNRLGVFAAGFSLEGAEAVGESSPVDKAEVSELLSSLVDKSLVMAEENGAEMRYRLLDTCKAYALEALETRGEQVLTKDRFLDYACDLALQLYEIECTLDIVRWQAAARLEHDNLVAAIEWALTGGRAPAKAGLILIKVVDYWLMIGFVSHTAHFIDRILAQLPSGQQELQIRLNVWAGAIASYGGDVSGLERIKMAHEMAKELGDLNVLRFATTRLGECAYELEQEETAIEMFHWVIDHCKEIDDPKMEGYVRHWLSNIYTNRGDYDLAEARLKEMASARDKLLDIRGLGIAYCSLAYLDRRRGGTKASDLYRKGLKQLAAIEDIHWLGSYLTLASEMLLDTTPHHAASIQGLGSRLREESGIEFEHYIKMWNSQILWETQARLGEHYAMWLREGRTMSIEEAIKRLDVPAAKVG